MDGFSLCDTDFICLPVLSSLSLYANVILPNHEFEHPQTKEKFESFPQFLCLPSSQSYSFLSTLSDANIILRLCNQSPHPFISLHEAPQWFPYLSTTWAITIPVCIPGSRYSSVLGNPILIIALSSFCKVTAQFHGAFCELLLVFLEPFGDLLVWFRGWAFWNIRETEGIGKFAWKMHGRCELWIGEWEWDGWDGIIISLRIRCSR